MTIQSRAPIAPKTDPDVFTAQKRSDALPPPPNDAICRSLGVSSVEVSWLAGDGSDRCYYRIFVPDTKKTFVLMQLSESDAKALRENGYDWVHVGKLLETHKIFVPRLIVALREFAALVIEDYGNTMLETKILEASTSQQDETIDRLYSDAFYILSQFLKIKRDLKQVWCQRAFDSERFVWEMNFFVQNYLEPVADIRLTRKEQGTFQEEALSLSRFLSLQSKWFVHRDFHSRNMMWKDGQLAVIDFQDARLGPSSYDLVSLCFDAYTPLSLDFRFRLIKEALKFLGIENGAEVAKGIETHWRPMLLQRQLKAIGSFGYLSIKKNRGNYLKYVTPALSTIYGNVIDDRWPFLSDVLLNKMAKSLP